MKKFKILLLFFFQFILTSTFAQAPQYSLNGEKINMEEVYINTLSIDSMDVDKHARPHGAVNICTKEPIAFLSIYDILDKRGIPLDKHTLIRINGLYIKELESIKIDPSFFIYIGKYDCEEIKYLNGKYKKLKLIEIRLESEEQRIIRIRGSR